MKTFNIIIIFFACLVFGQKTMADIVINKYAAVLSYSSCNALQVDSTNGFNVGDTVLMIQMKGAIVDSSNTVNFGSILNYNNCGNFEYNIISAINGNNIALKYIIVRSYDIPTGKVQLVKVPSYQNYTVNQVHTCMNWNGTKGGIFAINVVNALTLNDTITVNGAGFKGGKSDQNPILRSNACVSVPADYCMAPDFDMASNKGEGIADVSLSKSFGIGKIANGGGSGFSQNAGGGGGSNGNAGGKGGSEYVGCNNNPSNNLKGGIGGFQLSYSNIANKIFLGGGGGSGHVNNINLSNGGDGGGICLITAGSIIGNNKFIQANGNDGLQCTMTSAFGSCHDGMSGGGGGGVVLLNTTSIIGNADIQAQGGKGANENGWSGYEEVGPGGGGGGGVIWAKSVTFPPSVTSSVAGGSNGVVAYNNESWGAQPGVNGQTLIGLMLPFPTVLFSSSDLQPHFIFSRLNCFTFNFTDQTTASTSIASYNWDFGDGTNSSQQNPSHTFSGYGSYNVTLSVVASNGCTQSISQTILIPYIPFLHATGDTTICSNISIQLNATGAVSYHWSPATGLTNTSISNPVATVANSTTYIVTGLDTLGCTDIDSVQIIYQPYQNVVVTPKDPKICGLGSIQLNVSGINNPIWSPATGLDNALSANPIASPMQTTTYFVAGTSNTGCDGKDTVTIIVYPNPDVKIRTDHDTINCTDPFINLTVSGALSYAWSPSGLLTNSTSENTIAKVLESTEILVLGTDTNGCKGADSIYIYTTDNTVLFVPNAFSPNGDGVNDIFLPKYQCNLTLENFSVYNRFGQRVFYTANKYKGWDGAQNSKSADIGTYFYYIQGVDPFNQKVIKKGDVLLIR